MPNQSSLDALTGALLDPEHLVRNEAAQALLARLKHTDTLEASLINVEPAIGLLYLPSSTDRTAAVSILTELVQNPSTRASILRRAFPVLSQMLLASRPKSNKSAVTLLENATGLSYGRNVVKWRRAIGAPAGSP